MNRYFNDLSRLLLLLPVFFLLSSCNDDDENEVAGGSIIGEWAYCDEYYSNSDVTYLCSVSFNSDGSYVGLAFTDNEDLDDGGEFWGTYSISGSILTINTYQERKWIGTSSNFDMREFEAGESYRFFVSGNVLTLIDKYDDDWCYYRFDGDWNKIPNDWKK